MERPKPGAPLRPMGPDKQKKAQGIGAPGKRDRPGFAGRPGFRPGHDRGMQPPAGEGFGQAARRGGPIGATGARAHEKLRWLLPKYGASASGILTRPPPS